MDRLNRLDRMILRLATQRDLLRWAASLAAGLPGPVLEFGLGKGRTYDFLRALCADREIFAFDRDIHGPADCVPNPDHLFLGEFDDTLPAATARLGPVAALAHVDVGSEDRAADARLVAWLGLAVAPLLRPGALVVADRAMTVDGWRRLDPPDAGDGDHHVYRVAMFDYRTSTK